MSHSNTEEAAADADADSEADAEAVVVGTPCSAGTQKISCSEVLVVMAE